MPGKKGIYKYEKLYTNIKVIKKGIKKYKAHRFLWDTTHPKYYCQKWRLAAWEEVMNVWRKYYKKITLKYVKNRISHMRSNYTRQRKKVESQWLLHGIRYKPKLWYYDLMSFVGDPFNTSHADDIDEVKFAQKLEEKQNKIFTRRRVVAAASKGSVAKGRELRGVNLQHTCCIHDGYTIEQCERMKRMTPQTFSPLGSYTTLLRPEIKQERTVLFLRTTVNENDNNQFHKLLSSYVIENEEVTELPRSIFDFSFDKKELENIVNGLSPISFE